MEKVHGTCMFFCKQVLENTKACMILCKQVHESTKTCMFFCKQVHETQKHACFHVFSPISTHFPPK